MAGKTTGRRPLRAEARASSAGARAGRGATKAPAKAGHTKGRQSAKPARRRGGSGGGIVGLLLAPFRFVLRLIWALGWRLGLIAGLVLAGIVASVYATLPPAADLVDGRTRGSVTILDRYGDVFAWRGDQFGGVITAATVSPHLKNAIVATEDRRFYLHPGVDPLGVLGAVRINLGEGRGPLSGHGGSTITQQTAKLLCIGVPYDPNGGQTEAQYEAECRQGSLTRKAREAIYALAMEARYTKDEILTIYMNRAYLGAGTRGFEAASQRYFGKSANEVDPAEASMLAGLLVAPTRYAPPPTSSARRTGRR